MIINNEIWAFIPARSGSKSIKDKNLVTLNKPLLAHTLLAAKNCEIIDKIVFHLTVKNILILQKNLLIFYFIYVLKNFIG